MPESGGGRTKSRYLRRLQAANVGHDEGAIVPSVIADGAGEDLVGDGAGVGLGGEFVGDVALPEAVDDAVGTEQAAVAGAPGSMRWSGPPGRWSSAPVRSC